MSDYFTFTHEHLRVDLSQGKNDSDAALDDYEAIRDEWKYLHDTYGKIRVVDVSGYGMGRDFTFIDKLIAETGITALFATGYYKDPFLPVEVTQKTAAELAAVFVRDFTTGFENTNHKASLIAEIGTSNNIITPDELKVFTAASITHRETGCPISTHTTLGTMAREQLALFKAQGVNLERVILGHTDLAGSLELILFLLDSGVFVQFDTIGKIKYLPDETRISFITECVKRGYIKQLLLSVDLTRKSHLKKYGGIGYSYLIENFIPRLKEAGLNDADIRQMTVENPARIFA